MPASLTVNSAAELAATLAHTSALLHDKYAGYPAFTTLTPHLPETERQSHWERLLDAAARQLSLDDPRTGPTTALEMLDNALAAGGSADDLIDVDPELYRAVNPADRPGENDYDGYDIVALALDLAIAWDTELVRRALEAVELDDSDRVFVTEPVIKAAPITPTEACFVAAKV